ncbi:MAG: tRNA pseudouridine(38-40) synthase TruA [Alphaproteobacteria bacterium]|nr:tRNA pseudouridine(38-40) synthase TruA [Alphaproteobacteria bacterium]
MTRYRLVLEYDGGPFCGWQRQANGPSVQEKLETALGRLTGERVTAHAAGRTDAGVHALHQVVHVDLARAFPAERLREALNFHLRPCPIAVLEAGEAAPGFHARFSATGRSYLYRIVNRRAPLTVERGRAWAVPVPLDAQAMHAAAQGLLGRHDFTTFRAAQCQAASPVRTLDRFDVRAEGQLILCTVEARSFLHHQVRSMVGSLRRVGEGKWTAGDLAAALAAADRRACGPVAPAHGLYLTGVRYEGSGAGHELGEGEPDDDGE